MRWRSSLLPVVSCHPGNKSPESPSDGTLSRRLAISGRGAVGGNGLRQFHDLGFHFLARLELDHGAGGNRHVVLGAIRVAPDARLAEFHLEDAEVAQLDGLAVGEAFREVIKGALDDVEDILLHHAGLVANADDQIAFG